MKRRKDSLNGISIVIPVFNEGKNILNLIDEIEEVMTNIIKFEILVVDDGSTDNTYKNITKKKEYQKN